MASRKGLLTKLMNTPFIGIDFGTSKSAMSWYDYRNQRAEIIRNADGEEITPSIVYLGKGPDADLVGKLAQRKLQEDEQADQKRFVLSVKRDLLAAPNKVLDGRLYTPVDVATMILQKLKKDAEDLHFYQSVRRAVVTYPVSFETLQQDKIKQAAMQAGFEEIVLLPEPVAAALAYGQAGLQVGKHLLVYDFGGGTFDIAVLSRLSNGSFTPILPPKGLIDCGGDELDCELYDYCDEIALQTLHRPIDPHGLRNRRFLLYCRDRKENLSFVKESAFSTYLGDSQPVIFKHTLQRAVFEARIKHHIERTVALTRDMVQEARANKIVVDTVALIGGSSKVPLIAQLLGSTLPDVRPWQQSSFAVALGAAYYAHTLWGEKPPPPSQTTSSASSPSPTQPAGKSQQVVSSLSLQEEYRAALRSAWINRTSSSNLSREQVNKLDDLVQKLGLTAATASSIESEIVGMPRERTLEAAYQNARNEYRVKLSQTVADKRLTQAKVNSLVAYAGSKGLNNAETTTIEIEIMGYPKEAVLARGGHIVPTRLPKSLQVTKRWKFTWDKVLAILVVMIGSGAMSSATAGGVIFGLMLFVVGFVWFFWKRSVK
jgi:molecular chaperone DnaK (HSP70)